jgi:hypothetical protein
VAETGVVVLATLTFTGLVVGPTITPVRRAFAVQRARLQVRRLVRAGKLRSGHTTRVRLDDTGWTEFDGEECHATLMLPWSDVREIGMTDHYLFVGTAADKWTVVPARSVPDGRAFREFVGRVRDLALAGRTDVTGNDALRYVNRSGGGPGGGAVESG